MEKKEVFNDNRWENFGTGGCKTAEDSCSHQTLETMGCAAPDTRDENQCHGDKTNRTGPQIQRSGNPHKNLGHKLALTIEKWMSTPKPSKSTAQLMTALTTEVKSWLNSFIKTGIADPAPRVAHPENTMNIADETNATVFFHRGQLRGSLGSSVA